ncbi:MAG: hypothetical protein KJS77_07660 [Planctomycetes bacterium]|nr:hypothetical protein [Planctomycetota bacterium]
MRIVLLCIGFVLVGMACFTPSTAAQDAALVLVNNLPGQNSYGGWNDWPYGSAQLSRSSNYAAQLFTSGGSSYPNQSLTVTLWSQTLSGTAAMPLRIYTGDSNAPGFDPGNPASNLVTPLSFQGAFNIADGTPVASPSTSNAYLNRYESVSAVTLSAGTNYWVVALGLDGSDFVWDSGTSQVPVITAPPGTTFGSGFAWGSNAQWDGSSWQPYNSSQALMMEVQVVPEPSSAASALLIMTAAGALWRLGNPGRQRPVASKNRSRPDVEQFRFVTRHDGVTG